MKLLQPHHTLDCFYKDLSSRLRREKPNPKDLARNLENLSCQMVNSLESSSLSRKAHLVGNMIRVLFSLILSLRLDPIGCLLISQDDCDAEGNSVQALRKTVA
jgi:hypothetical protein